MKKTAIIFILISGMFLGGCEGFMDEKYPPESPWKTLDQLEMGVALPYSEFTNGWSSPWAIYSFYDMMSTDMARYTGLFINAPIDEFINRKHRETALESSSAGWIGQVYYQSYRTIAGSNDVLSFLNSEEDPTVLFPRDHKDRVETVVPRAKAEMYFFRAWSYYYLALMFTPPYEPGGANDKKILPLKTDMLNPSNTKIGTAEEIWAQVISDLEIAKSLMSPDWRKEGRINYYTISGLLARAYFYTGQHGLAEDECTEIIDQGSFSLQDSIMWAFASAPGEAEAPEVIFSMVPNEFGNGLHYNLTAINKTYHTAENGGRYEEGVSSWNQSGWVVSILSNTILEKIGWMTNPLDSVYTETDLARMDSRYTNTWLRMEEYRKVNECTGSGVSRDSCLNVYESKNSRLDFPHLYLDKYYRGVLGNNTRFPVMRLPEFYLMRAAIRYNASGNAATAGADNAAADLNVVRSRAGLPVITGADITSWDLIDREMIIEMGGEGLYLPYLMALRRPIENGDPNQRENEEVVNAPYSTWYWRIPVDEINKNAGYEDYNPNMD